MKQLDAQQLVGDLVNNLTVGIFQIRSSPDHSFVREYSNQAAQQLARINQSDLEQSGLLSFRYVHPDDQARVRTAIRDAVDTGKPLRELIRFEFPDEKWGWILVEASVRTNPDNTKTWTGSIADITKEGEQIGPLQSERSDNTSLIDELGSTDTQLQDVPKPVWVKPASEKNRLLFVDDDSVSRTTMTALLTAEGYEIDDVDSGAEALVKLQFNDYDAVLIDYRMPQMSGLELAAFIRDGYIGALYPPVLIAITGGLSEQEREDAEIAFDKIVIKPIKAKALSLALTKILAQS